MVQEDDVIGPAAALALAHRLPAAQAGVHLNSVAPQHALGHHQIHFLIVHSQGPDAYAGKGLPSRSLVLRKPALPVLPVEQVCHREGGKGLMYDQQLAGAGRNKLLFRDHNDTVGAGQILIVVRVLLIHRLGDENMGQAVAALQFEQALEIMGRIALDSKPHYQIHYNIPGPRHRCTGPV